MRSRVPYNATAGVPCGAFGNSGMERLETCFEFTARVPVLVVTAAVSAALIALLFPALPIGGELLDGRFGYTLEEALAAMAGYGEEGRRVYAWASLTADTLLPVAYACCLAGLVYRLRPKDDLWVLACLPVVAGVLDLCENGQIVAMLIQFPDVSAGQATTASLFTQMKGCAVLASLATVALLAGLALVRRIRNIGQ